MINILQALRNTSLKAKEYTDSQIENNVDWVNLKNKPFYSEPTLQYETILEETTLTLNENVSLLFIYGLVGLEDGKTYRATFNGVEYTCTAKELDLNGVPGIGIGNMSLIGGENTNEPFLMGDSPSENIFAVMEPSGLTSVTIKIEEVVTEIIHHLDSKFVKDMYYSEGVVTSQETMLEETTISIDEEGLFDIELSSMLIDGDTYRVMWNNTEYTCVAFEDDGACGIGNISKMMGIGDTGEPFVIITVPEGESIVAMGMVDESLYSTSITLSIIHEKNVEKLHYIDPKFIKDIPYSSIKDVPEQKSLYINGIEYNGSDEVNVNVPSKLPNPYSLSINGIGYDGSSYKSIETGAPDYIINLSGKQIESINMGASSTEFISNHTYDEIKKAGVTYPRIFCLVYSTTGGVYIPYIRQNGTTLLFSKVFDNRLFQSDSESENYIEIVSVLIKNDNTVTVTRDAIPAASNLPLIIQTEYDISKNTEGFVLANYTTIKQAMSHVTLIMVKFQYKGNDFIAPLVTYNDSEIIFATTIDTEENGIMNVTLKVTGTDGFGTVTSSTNSLKQLATIVDVESSTQIDETELNNRLEEVFA